MTRGQAEFEDYVRSLQEKEAQGEELTENEQVWLDQGVIAGVKK